MADEKLMAEEEAGEARDEKAGHARGMADASQKEADAEKRKADADERIKDTD